jgi:two-component system response regulator (stage 0 sporulation protein A)
MTTVRILIADDNQDYCFMLSSVLSHVENFEITGVVFAGNEVMDTIHRTKPDVVLLDIVMPEMDGLEVLAAIHAMGRQKPHVFVVTALCSEDIIRRCKALDIHDFFVKPADIPVIISKIQEIYAAPTEAQKLQKLLHLMKIPSQILGFKYLRDLVLLYHKDRSQDISLLSQELAASSQVDYALFRNSVRYAIKIAWDMDNSKDKNSIFYSYRLENHNRPNISRVVKLLSARLD